MLKRQKYPMSPDIRIALQKSGLMTRYNERPPYQRNDYIGWIMRAKRKETRSKRLAQMIRELREGGVYMNMKWRAK
ncbi:YdeI/OmpD-associated family protein [Candidatus Kaiserbacteria bacterium]|nr:YdeI/OmpD-associated family protein [Candidatus Kaiserbacteria bacterium]